MSVTIEQLLQTACFTLDSLPSAFLSSEQNITTFDQNV